MIDHGTTPLPHLFSIPSDGAAEPRPVLCFLHGYDEGAPADIDVALTMHGPLRSRNPRRVTDEFIVVAPQLPVQGDLWISHEKQVATLVRRFQKTFGGDPARTYLTGFSFGGNGVFDLALAQPGLWTALWAVDPTRVPLSDSGLPVWLSFGEVARRRRSGFVERLGPESPDRRFVDQGADHVGSATLAYGDNAIYEWLLTHRSDLAIAD